MVRLPRLPGVALGGARLPWHPADGLALPAEDGRLWRGGKRAGWNRGHDLATGAPLNRPGRDAEIRAGESVRAVARALRVGHRAAVAVGWINAGSAPAGVRLRTVIQCVGAALRLLRGWQRLALLGGPIAVSAGAITASESVTVGFSIGVLPSGDDDHQRALICERSKESKRPSKS